MFPSQVKVIPVAMLPRVGLLATMPTRLATFRQVFDAVIGQLDRLYVFLDGHETVPDFLNHPKVIAMRASEEGMTGCAGRYLGIGREKGNCVCIVLDDDIHYPPDYVARLVKALVRYKGRAAVGFHGEFFLPPYKSFVKDRLCCHFQHGLSLDTRIEALGSGTSAFVASTLPVDPRKWPYNDIDDMTLALIAEDRGVPRVALARDAGYLTSIEHLQPDSLWNKARKDDSRQSEYMRQLVAMERQSPWGVPAKPRVHQPPAQPAER